MIPGLDPKKMQAMMKQMGMSQEEIDANRVIIETDEKNIIITNPSVVKINMQGQENFQISGNISEEELSTQEEPQEDNSEDDIKTIIEKTGVSEEEARNALDGADGDLTDALMGLE